MPVQRQDENTTDSWTFKGFIMEKRKHSTLPARHSNNTNDTTSTHKILRQNLYFLLLIVFSQPIIITDIYGGTLADQDAIFRQDLQALNDAGYLDTLTNTWPIPWPAVQQALAQLKGQALPAHLLRAKQNIARITAKNIAPLHVSARVTSSTEPTLLTQFGANKSEDDSLQAALAFNHQHGQARLSARAVNSATDAQDYQLDGSYISANINAVGAQWAIGVGQFDRWWGPGWQSSLILSNNARPIPMLYLSRQDQTPFTSRYLSWLGPWHLVTFMGQLESHRIVPEAQLWGLRLSFSPHRYWEIGLSRTATWAGEGRPSGLDTFVDVLLGRDNFEADDPGKLEEPGNQLGGIDIRFGRPFRHGSLATYVQVIGEDEAGNLPSRPVILGGASLTLPFKQAPMTLAIEYQDTALDSYSDPIFNSAYNHGIYHTGYRYRGRSIGASTDNDTQRFSVGAMFQPAPRWHISTWFSSINGNRDGNAARNPVFQNALETNHATLSAQYTIGHHRLILGSNWWQDVPENLLNRSNKSGFFLDYQWTLARQ